MISLTEKIYVIRKVANRSIKDSSSFSNLAKKIQSKINVTHL